MWHLGTSCYAIRVGRSFDERIQASMPEMVVFIVTLKNKLITNVVAWTHSCFGVGAILLLQFRIDLLVYYRYFYFMP